MLLYRILLVSRIKAVIMVLTQFKTVRATFYKCGHSSRQYGSASRYLIKERTPFYYKILCRFLKNVCKLLFE